MSAEWPTNWAGTDGTAIVTPAGGQGIRGWLSGIYKRLGEALRVIRITDVAQAGTLTSAAGEQSAFAVAVVEGMTMVVAWFHGAYEKATVAMEASFDGGATWMVLMGGSIGAGTATTTPLSSSTNGTIGWEAAIPAGVTHVRAHCTAITSGTVEVKIAQGSSEYETVMGVVPSGLIASSAVVGGVFAPGAWTDLSSTNLGAAATFTGAAVDLFVVATATAFTNASTGATEYRASATADVVGTLYLETSRDNVTFKRVKSMKLAQAEGCEYYGEIIHRPSERYCRAAFVNGAGAQAFFKLQQVRVAVA